MKGYDLHDLQLKEIKIGGEIEKAYHQFLDILKSKNKEINPENAFLAGYMLANPILRGELKKYRTKEIEINLHFN